MKNCSNPLTTCPLVLLFCLTLTPSTALGDALTDHESLGVAALQRNDFARAQASFQEALAEARKQENKVKIADELFYLGLTLQRSIDPAAAAAKEQMRQAAGYYESALKLRPDSAATLNNLGQLYALQGSNHLALAALKRSVSLSDPRQSTYAVNYADTLLKSGEWKEACRFYALAAWAQPDNEAVHDKIAEVCLKHDPVLLQSYAWDMAEHGQVLQAQKYALDALTSRRGSWAEKDELLALVAVCLSKEPYRPSKFFEKPVASLLEKLAGEQGVGPGCGELLQLHKGERLRPSDYPWWSQRVHVQGPAPRGVWPGEAFQQLCRSLAERSGPQAPALREKYLLLAATLNPQAPDPDALVQLADLYAGSDRLGQLVEMMRRYEASIFEAKGEVIRTGQIDKIYKFHTALGVIYSHMGRWGSSGQPDSAVFQLEHALNLTQSQPLTPDAVPLAPRLVTLLADGYWKTQPATRAFQFEIENSNRFLEKKDSVGARHILEHLQARPEFNSLSEPEKLEVNRTRTAILNLGDSQANRFNKAGLATVRVTGPARSVVDSADTRSLSQTELHALENFIAATVQADTNQPRARQFELLPSTLGLTNVKELSINGTQGRMLMEKDGKTLVVPFTVDLPGAQKPVNARYVRP